MKTIIFILAALFLISSVTAITDLNSFPRDTDINFRVPCRTNDGGVCDSTYDCFITVSYPNSSLALNKVNMSKVSNSAGYYNATLKGFPTGDYNNVEVYCSNNILNGTESYRFSIIGDGSEPTITEGFVYLIVVIVCILVLILSLWGIMAIRGGNTVDGDGNVINVNNLKYLKIVLGGIVYVMLFTLAYFGMNISYKVLSFDLATSIFRYIFNILLYAFIPFCVLLFTFLAIRFIKDMKIKKMLSIGGEFHE